MPGIYIHIPFCKQSCNYCNFHFSVSQKNKSELLASLVKEISSPQNFIDNKNIETIYIGGGTPSLLSYAELEIIFAAIHHNFNVLTNAEITIEANPDDINTIKLKEWLKLGVNRLSVGIQSFDEAELQWMNRAHNAAQSLQCIDEILDVGFTNFSVDLIYGSPMLNNKSLINNVEIIAGKNVPHISCYALTVESGTKLNRQILQKKSSNIDNEKQAEQYLLLMELMKTSGYEQYEISSFCKPNYRSNHNSSYWQGKPYFGFGPSAHAYNGSNKRRWNIANNTLYTSNIEKNIIYFEEETLTQIQQLNEYVMTALRTVEGINFHFIEKKFGIIKANNILREVEKYVNSNKVLLKNNVLTLTNVGKFFADGIASDLFDLPNGN